MMIDSELAKKSIISKLFVLLITILILVSIIYKLEYSFSNIPLNSVLLYFLGFTIKFVFTFNSIDFYFDLAFIDYQVDIKEYEAKELELRLKYPKLYIYNQAVLYISTFVKLLSVLLFIYGSTQLIF